MSLVKKRVGLLLILSLGLVSALAMAQSNRVLQAIESRVKPVGELCMAGEECAESQAVARDSDEPRPPSEIYSAACASCHDSGAAGAPVTGVAGDWADRREKGVDTLYANAIDGIGGMPAMGLCTDCSEEEIQLTVDYILDES